MNEAVIGKVLHPLSHLCTDGNLEGKSKDTEEEVTVGVLQVQSSTILQWLTCSLKSDDCEKLTGQK